MQKIYVVIREDLGAWEGMSVKVHSAHSSYEDARERANDLDLAAPVNVTFYVSPTVLDPALSAKQEKPLT